jgi:hypothetical protein
VSVVVAMFVILVHALHLH